MDFIKKKYIYIYIYIRFFFFKDFEFVEEKNENHLILKICQCDHLGEQNIMQNALNRKKYFFRETNFFWKHKLRLFFLT